MFRRIRQLRISLAAKCQILFGAAVVLIIAAALAVPWLRIDQLSEQLNSRAAGAVADEAIAQHIRAQRSGEGRDWTLLSTAPSGPSVGDENQHGLPPRLVPLSAVQGNVANRFEKHAVAHFEKQPTSRFYSVYYQRNDRHQTAAYRFARPIHLQGECITCHGSSEARATTLPVPPNVHPLPTEGPSHLIGIVSVDIASQIQMNQLLLNRVFILSAGLLAGTLAILSFYLITTRLILQPVRVLQETAEKVSQGDLNIRSDISTGDEFQLLSETFNTMLANLKQSADQLRAINKGLDLKLGQLAESNLALYESNRLKSEFLANVSHELRTPLNSILGFADLLKDALGSGADGKTARYVNNILQSGKHLLDLINDLLDLAKIEAGKMEIRSEPLSLNDLFEGLTNILKPLSEREQVMIVSGVAPDVPIIWTDPGKLQQILYNFLSNAIKYSPAGDRIDLIAQRDGEEHVRISVTDRGPGIEPEKQQIIFEKFRQVDASVTRTHGGTGLGLAISKELASLLGGSIGVRSTPGEGATFWIVVPLRIEAGAMDMRGRLVLT